MTCRTYVVLHSPESHSLLASAVVKPTELGGPWGGFFHGVELSHAALSLDHRRGVQQFGEHRCSKHFVVGSFESIKMSLTCVGSSCTAGGDGGRFALRAAATAIVMCM